MHGARSAESAEHVTNAQPLHKLAQIQSQTVRAASYLASSAVVTK